MLVDDLRDHAVACDWGSVGYAQAAKNAAAVAGYIVKVAGTFDRKVGEISKLTQAPLNARMKLRRIRAGKGFLEARPKGCTTGVMLVRKRQLDGTVFVKPLMEPDQVRCRPELVESYLLGVRTAIKDEQKECDDEFTEANGLEAGAGQGGRTPRRGVGEDRGRVLGGTRSERRSVVLLHEKRERDESRRGASSEPRSSLAYRDGNSIRTIEGRFPGDCSTPVGRGAVPR